MGKILIVGDLFPVNSNLERFSNGDVEGLFDEKIRELFSEADYRICNLEGALTNSLERCEKTGPVITAPTSVIEVYKKLGIDCCMLANNHITDAGHQGVIDTMSTLDQVNISYLGAGENVDSIVHYSIIQIEDKSIGLYNVCETMYNQPTNTKAGAYIYDEYIVCKELESLKQKCDYLVVIYHGGIEKYRYPSPETRKRFQRMADNGADIILSQHTHCIGCEEYYNGSYFLYGQGDFMLKNFIERHGLVLNKQTNRYDYNHGMYVHIYASDLEDGHFKIPLGKIDGNFVVDDDLNSTFTSLFNGPTEVTGKFDISHNRGIKSLQYAPTKVGGDFNAGQCYDLKSLEGGPEYVGGDYNINWCYKLHDLKGAPKIINGNFFLNHCRGLSSLNDGPEQVKGSIKMTDTPNLNKEVKLAWKKKVKAKKK